jgi:hypothetical protein
MSIALVKQRGKGHTLVVVYGDPRGDWMWEKWPPMSFVEMGTKMAGHFSMGNSHCYLYS